MWVLNFQKFDGNTTLITDMKICILKIELNCLCILFELPNRISFDFHYTNIMIRITCTNIYVVWSEFASVSLFFLNFIQFNFYLPKKNILETIFNYQVTQSKWDITWHGPHALIFECVEIFTLSSQTAQIDCSGKIQSIF
jgi:hypothetical protein